MKKEELKVAYLTHGLQHLRHITLRSPVRHVAYNAHKNLFVVLDAANQLHLHRDDGWSSSSRAALEPMAGLLHATQVNQYVAWDTGGLQVLDPNFRLLSRVCSSQPIRCCRYSQQLNQVLTAGDGTLSIWVFRYGFRRLRCRATVSEGLSPQDTFTRLVLDTSSNASPPRCFATCGTSVATFDLSKWELVALKRELHSRAITDIAYCEVVGCVVTASRDTTIKVWDREWLIQMVFVGHTAPVTAVTIYPQRPLILSASQDGTIRTWNLETVDQVDEVQVPELVEELETHTEEGHIISISGSAMDLWKVNHLYTLHTQLGSAVHRLSTVNLAAVGKFPVRTVCICQDSSVRLVASHSGEVLATLFLDRPLQALEAAYCLPRETLFVLMEHGCILRANAAINPMTIKKTVPPASPGTRPCCLLLYGHLVDPEKACAIWRDVVEHKGDRKQWHKLPLPIQDKNR
uniref:Uncharacterized protein n=1 Tax=Sphenodon punctatus TaxID=8508 RepID=A0A8D0HF51_SPHPU